MSVKLRLSELEHIAARAGYESYRAMLFDLYCTQLLPMDRIARQLNIAATRLRRHLIRFGIAVRRKNQRPSTATLVMTPELLHEIMRDGVPAVAERCRVTQGVIIFMLKKLQK